MSSETSSLELRSVTSMSMIWLYKRSTWKRGASRARQIRSIRNLGSDILTSTFTPIHRARWQIDKHKKYKQKSLNNRRSYQAAASKEVLVEAHERKWRWRMRRGEDVARTKRLKIYRESFQNRDKTKKAKTREMKTRKKYCRSLRVQERDKR